MFSVASERQIKKWIATFTIILTIHAVVKYKIYFFKIADLNVFSNIFQSICKLIHKLHFYIKVYLQVRVLMGRIYGFPDEKIDVCGFFK